ncbi:hypothetical protein [Coleofasciculus sp. FACHB-SPT36]|uniref:hypothetical protein n=1 Tax=Cyanophyceae TaxID=3028117 RepID=UPI00168A8F88|nr:hypothetical protein [Coleofasciculus sp. FACHB-SPT36]MBD2540147.1 hypothetical protein [Coleofasciculus sp. FACHB-SPT36]
MTVSQDFIPSDEGQDEAAYPSAFGITFTPTVSGALLAVLGLAGAAYLVANLLLPAWTSYQQLQTDVENTEQQIQQQAQLQQKIDAAKVNLGKAKQQRAAVLSMFGSSRTLDTLMLDINRFVKARQGKLTKYEPRRNDAADASSSDIITDGSLGPEVNGKLKRKVYNVSFEGDYGQTQSILRSLERLQQLLVVKDLKSDLKDAATSQKITVNRQGQIVPSGKPKERTLINTSFRLEVLLPLSEQEAKEAAAAAAAAAAAQPPQ